MGRGYMFVKLATVEWNMTYMQICFGNMLLTICVVTSLSAWQTVGPRDILEGQQHRLDHMGILVTSSLFISRMN